MEENINEVQIFEIKKTNLFWLYFVGTGILVILGVFLLPVWSETNVFFKSWSNASIDIILAVLLVLYIIFYLVKNLKNDASNKILRIVEIIEIILLLLISVLCVLEQFNVTDFIGPCLAIGLAVYLRGIVLGIDCFLHTQDKNENFSLLTLIFMFASLTFGSMIIVNPIYGDGFMWIISISILVVAIVLSVFGALAIPDKKKEE